MVENKYALVTGASSGIGFELCRILARENYNLIMVARREDELKKAAEQIQKEHRTKLIIIAKDLSNIGNAEEVYDQIKRRRITVSILINNAGFGTYGEFSKTDWKTEEEMIVLNTISLTHLTKLFLPEMLARNDGKIMNLASTAAFLPGPLMAVYYATKAYVLSFTESVASEIEGSRVTITALCPGPTQSGFQKAAHMEESKLIKNKTLPTAQSVAEFGYRKMMQGKRVAIPGFHNIVLTKLGWILPRRIVARLVKKYQESKQPPT